MKNNSIKKVTNNCKDVSCVAILLEKFKLHFPIILHNVLAATEVFVCDGLVQR